MQKIFIGSDHAAYDAKESLKEWFSSSDSQQFEIIDLGPDSAERCDYPDYASAVAREVQKDPKALGVLLCGSGIGVSMVANRYQKVRAAFCCTPEQAALTRQHNNANILCLGARVNSTQDHQKITRSWLDAEFEGGRHSKRVQLFNDLGEKV